MKKLAIFASGSGSNAQNIAEYFEKSTDVSISLILTNNSSAYVIERAKLLRIPYVVFNKEQFTKSNFVLDFLFQYEIDFIVLAGFLWLIPQNILSNFSAKIINIHPALLPKYGGKGMYGEKVHQSVVANNETESGITIHYVNDRYDEGNIIFQAKCTVETSDTADSLAQKIHKLEYENFPKVIEKLLVK